MYKKENSKSIENRIYLYYLPVYILLVVQGDNLIVLDHLALHIKVCVFAIQSYKIL